MAGKEVWSLLYSIRGKSQCSSVQFTQLCLILCNPMHCSTADFPVHHGLPELAQTHVHRVDDGIQPSHPLSSPFPAFNFSQHQGLFWMSQFFASGDQRIGASASASVLSMNMQDLFPLGLTGLTSLQSKGYSRVFGGSFKIWKIKFHCWFSSQLYNSSPWVSQTSPELHIFLI